MADTHSLRTSNALPELSVRREKLETQKAKSSHRRVTAFVGLVLTEEPTQLCSVLKKAKGKGNEASQ